MKCLLAILTHGRSETLPAALRAFRDNVVPLPTEITVVADAVEDVERIVGAVRGTFPEVEDPTLMAIHPTRQRGFCRATGELWRRASATDLPYVFWLEHDFLVARRTSLRQIASVLDGRHDLAQMALMRNACNDDERAAGGLVESRPGAYTKSAELVDALRVEWLEHRAYFTTNPSLMRTEFVRENRFLDDGLPYCEGRFGILLGERGYRFGAWGDGSPWCEHVGVRDELGKGY